ncbi:unnamed protein product, partial [Ascophyllum nodosum]
MAPVDNSIGGAAGDASSGQEPIDVEPGSSPSPMDNEVKYEDMQHLMFGNATKLVNAAPHRWI